MRQWGGSCTPSQWMIPMRSSWSGWGAIPSSLKSEETTLKEISVLYFFEINKCLSRKKPQNFWNVPRRTQCKERRKILKVFIIQGKQPVLNRLSFPRKSYIEVCIYKKKCTYNFSLTVVNGAILSDLKLLSAD